VYRRSSVKLPKILNFTKIRLVILETLLAHMKTQQAQAYEVACSISLKGTVALYDSLPQQIISPSLEADSNSQIPKIHRLLWNLKIHPHLRYTTSLHFMLRQLNPAHINLTYHTSKTHFNIILSRMRLFPTNLFYFQINVLKTFLSACVCSSSTYHLILLDLIALMCTVNSY
jgi:hypothetical protein